MTAPRMNPAVTLALTTLLAGCVTPNNGEANSPQASGPLCRVTIESWKGTAEAQVHGQTSDVQGLMGSSTAVIEGGSKVVIKGWLGDVSVGRVESDRFVVYAWGKEFPSDGQPTPPSASWSCFRRHTLTGATTYGERPTSSAAHCRVEEGQTSYFQSPRAWLCCPACESSAAVAERAAAREARHGASLAS